MRQETVQELKAILTPEQFAQWRQIREAGRAKQIATRLHQIADELNLTPEQKQQIKPILKAAAQAFQAIRDDQSLSRLEKLQKLKAVHQETAQELKAILTPEQLAKWQQIRETARQKR